ncbi:MAG TPA: multidrug efflux RND transporter permease subunit [Steroidobacteraceae bacterium]|jgi:multidrug efflux pump|nr:multidrug efflux RND transporter permease subunit [Steroidobacteraceae bacterium]
MARFFIEHPIFAWVIAILITLAGILSIIRLPIEAYPDIAPPQVQVSANYPGADAEVTEHTVTQIIEQQLTGIDNLLYFTSSSNSSGNSNVTLTFDTGTDPDTAVVQTQNRATLATPRLPAEAAALGLKVQKASTTNVIVLALQSTDGGMNSYELGNLLATRVLDQIQRINGVANVQQFGSEYAMRIWLNPDRLHAYGLSPAQVLATVQSQNVQVATGSIGAVPTVPNQQLSINVSVPGRFTSQEQFENIILRTDPNGTTVRLRDVARLELGPYTYGLDDKVDGKPIAGCGIAVLPGADALKVVQAIRDRMNELQRSFPPGVTWLTPFDATQYISVSIREVVYTLGGSVVLVFLVMLVFLQNVRATLIPTLVMPVALLGAFVGIYAVGFSINTLSLFGVALAIGIVVDDAIVVIESVERIMREEHLPPKEATRKAMGQITGAIVAITVVLAAVFIPSALQTGSVGAIYRQFALTIAISMLFSAFLALTFTPALCATLLRPGHLNPNVVFRGFNHAFQWSLEAYMRRVFQSVRHAPRWMIAFAVLVAVGAWLFVRMPGGFLPEEDQGYAYVIVQTPPGTTLDRTMQVMTRVGTLMHQNPDVDAVMEIAGFSFVGQGENVGLGFVRLKPWEKRRNTSATFIAWANRILARNVHDANAYSVNLPTVRGLGQFGGFDLYLQDRAGIGRDALEAAQKTLLSNANQSPILANVRANTLEDAPRLDLNVDRVQAETMGLSASDLYGSIQLMMAPVYANDFYYQGRVLRVMLQADAPYRMGPEALNHYYLPSTLPSASGAVTGSSAGTPLPTMIPLSSVVHPTWTVASPNLTRYNGYSAVEITGSNTAGRSTGEAMIEMQNQVAQLPDGVGSDWAGQSLQEKLSGAQAPALFSLSILVVYLCLAALYESWSVPVSVLLVVPVGVIGAIAAAQIRGLSNDVFFKVGLITIIGLAAKNAILIVEFAVMEHAAGKTLHDAVVEAARLRFRPILMTSFAFILGVMPLVLSSGAGANARHAIGTGVAGGMITAAVLGVLFVPVFFVSVRRLLGDPLDGPRRKPKDATPSSPMPGGME